MFIKIYGYPKNMKSFRNESKFISDVRNVKESMDNEMIEKIIEVDSDDYSRIACEVAVYINNANESYGFASVYSSLLSNHRYSYPITKEVNDLELFVSLEKTETKSLWLNIIMKVEFAEGSHHNFKEEITIAGRKISIVHKTKQETTTVEAEGSYERHTLFQIITTAIPTKFIYKKWFNYNNQYYKQILAAINSIFEHGEKVRYTDLDENKRCTVQINGDNAKLTINVKF